MKPLIGEDYLEIVLGGINILLPVYGITNSKRYSVFWSSTDTQITSYNSAYS